MSHSIPDLWPSMLEVKVLTPATILHAQAAALARRTQGVIKGDVSESSASPERIKLDFDLFSPPIRYTERLFSVQYDKKKVYPATITSQALTSFDPYDVNFLGRSDIDKSLGLPNICTCYIQDSFLALVGYIFNHRYTRSSLESILARCSEVERNADGLEENYEGVESEGETNPG